MVFHSSRLFFHGSRWVFYVFFFYVFGSVFIISGGFLWFFIVPGFLLFMVSCQIVWVFEVHGWSFRVPGHFLKFFKAPGCFSWFQVVFHGFPWLQVGFS